MAILKWACKYCGTIVYSTIPVCRYCEKTKGFIKHIHKEALIGILKDTYPEWKECLDRLKD